MEAGRGEQTQQYDPYKSEGIESIHLCQRIFQCCPNAICRVKDITGSSSLAPVLTSMDKIASATTNYLVLQISSDIFFPPKE